MNEQLMPEAAAAIVLSWLERRGAIVSLNAENFLRINLDPIVDLDDQTADAIARSTLQLRHELRAILIARQVTH